MSDTKRCGHCKELKETTEYNTDLRAKDKLQRLCKTCKALQAKARKEGKVTPRALKKQKKLQELALDIAQGNTLQRDASRLLNSASPKDLEAFRDSLVDTEIMESVKDFFGKILTNQVPCTIDEYLKALAGWGKFTGGFAPDKVETTTKSLPEETRKQTMADVAKMLEDRDKE
jgi:hypothetical protein